MLSRCPIGTDWLLWCDLPFTTEPVLMEVILTFFLLLLLLLSYHTYFYVHSSF